MANPTTLTSLPAVLVSDTTPASVTVDAERVYVLSHNGLDASGSADVNAIFLSHVAAVDADHSEAEDKIILLSTRSVVVGPGVTTIKFGTAAGAPTFQVMSGTSN